MDLILNLLVQQFPIAGLVLALLGMLVVVGAAVVALTPSKSDDAAWERIKAVPLLGQLLSALMAFSPVQKR